MTTLVDAFAIPAELEGRADPRGGGRPPGGHGRPRRRGAQRGRGRPGVRRERHRPGGRARPVGSLPTESAAVVAAHRRTCRGAASCSMAGLLERRTGRMAARGDPRRGRGAAGAGRRRPRRHRHRRAHRRPARRPRGVRRLRRAAAGGQRRPRRRADPRRPARRPAAGRADQPGLPADRGDHRGGHVLLLRLAVPPDRPAGRARRGHPRVLHGHRRPEGPAASGCPAPRSCSSGRRRRSAARSSATCCSPSAPTSSSPAPTTRWPR